MMTRLGRNRRPTMALVVCLHTFPVAAAPQTAEVVAGETGTWLHQRLLAAADSGFNGVVMVVIGGQPILHKAYGYSDRLQSVPVTISTPFWVASVTKTFTAAAVMKLVEQGSLSVHDSIGRFLPNVPPDKEGITIHQLLTHTAGLDDHDAGDGVVERDLAIAAILRAPLARTPASAYGYTNDAYNLLAAIVEIVAGKPYESFLRDEMLGGAGLTDTGFWGPAEAARVADILPPAWGSAITLRPNWGYRGARGMFSTAADLYRWHEALLEHRVLSATSVNALMTPHTFSGSTGVGYGWFLTPGSNDMPSLWSRGNQGSGHGAVLAAFPAQSGLVAIVSNTDRYAPNAPMGHNLAAEVVRRVFGR